MPTNRQRVLDLIRAVPGLADSEIRERTGIEPHQQVNQICQSLESAGLTRRVRGVSGRIVNEPVSIGDSLRTPADAKRTQARLQVEKAVTGLAPVPSTLTLSSCLFVVPCSQAKARGKSRQSTRSLITALPTSLAMELADVRRRNAADAQVDESGLMPAVQRYIGGFYQAGRPAIQQLVAKGARVLILSGGYGLVAADEPIGWYDQEFRAGMWPNRVIERCLAAFAEETEAAQVVGVLSASTSYVKVLRRTRWPDCVDLPLLATPERVPDARKKAPRAEGEWLAALAEGGHLPRDWVSSDNLRMEISLL